MIPEQFKAASLSDEGMMLAENSSSMAVFLTCAQNPAVFDQWSRHIRENWHEQPSQLFRYTRPESESEQEPSNDA